MIYSHLKAFVNHVLIEIAAPLAWLAARNDVKDYLYFILPPSSFILKARNNCVI